MKDIKNNVETLIRTSGQEDNITIRPDAKISTMESVRVSLKDGTTLDSDIGSIAGDFIKGGSDGIVKGIASIASKAITALIGSGSGSEQVANYYYVATEGYAILRVDVGIWTRNIKANAMTIEKEVDLFAFYAVKSTVDLSKITFPTFLAVYQNQLFYGHSKKDSNEKISSEDICKEVKKDLNQAYQVFHMLKEPEKAFSTFKQQEGHSNMLQGVVQPQHNIKQQEGHNNMLQVKQFNNPFLNSFALRTCKKWSESEEKEPLEMIVSNSNKEINESLELSGENSKESDNDDA